MIEISNMKNSLPHDLNRKCIKCDCPSAAVSFQTYMTLNLPEGDNGERLQRTCGRCGYVWFELPMDHRGLAR